MIQIYGTPKCKETKKAERYCKERSIPYQFRDLLEKGISPRELEELLQQWDSETIIDSSSQFYKNQGYQYLEFNSRDEILAHPQLCKTPLIRKNKKWLVGFDLSQIKTFLE
jgi:arsenate reductase